MPRLNYAKIRGKKYAYHRGDYDDPDYAGRSDDYPRFRNDWRSGRHGRHNAQRPHANTEVIRRVFCIDGPSGSQPQANVTTGGETWTRANVANAASLSIEFFKESFGAALGTPIRMYNFMLKNDSCVFFFKLRSKKLSESIQSIKSIINPNTNSPIVCDIKACFEPDVPCSTSTNPDLGIAASLLPESWMAALKDCFKERFQLAANTLDLSSLHTDLTLLNRGYYIPLNKDIVFSSFIVILQENNAKLSTLNLSHNRLRNLQPFEKMRRVLGQPTYSFERVDLSGNYMDAPHSLVALSHVPGVSNIDLSDTPLFRRLSNPKYKRAFESYV